MKIKILPKNNDDIEFTRIISNILDNLILLTKPKEVFVIQINHRFDYKWLGFSHKASGALEIWRNVDLRIPPFVPEKVIEESYFQLKDDVFVQEKFAKLHIHQSSQNNENRKIKLFSNSGIFLWYSGNSQTDSQSSLMAYSIKQEIENCWFVSFNKNKNWKVSGSRNISLNELKTLMGNNSFVPV